MRYDYVSKLEKYNINYWNEVAFSWDSTCKINQEYWSDNGYLIIDRSVEQRALTASMELHGMMLEAVDMVVKDDNLKNLFGIPYNLWKPITESWNNK
jgi:glutathionylspermidine synthase